MAGADGEEGKSHLRDTVTHVRMAGSCMLWFMINNEFVNSHFANKRLANTQQQQVCCADIEIILMNVAKVKQNLSVIVILLSKNVSMTMRARHNASLKHEQAGDTSSVT